VRTDRRLPACRRAVWVAVILAVGAGLPVPTHAATITPAAGATKAVAWLKTRIGRDGSLAGNLSLTAELIIAVKAAGQNPNTFSSPSPVAYLRRQTATILRQNVGVIGKVALAVSAAGADPSSFGGIDLIAAIRSTNQLGLFDAQLFDQSFAMMALRAGGRPSGNLAFTQVFRQQDLLGGWGFAGPRDPDTNSTAVAMQAIIATSRQLIGSPVGTTSLLRAVRYLHGQQNDDGAFSYQRTSHACAGPCPSDPNSTAYVIQALVAAGQDVRAGWWLKNGRDPIAALLAMQRADGSFAGFSPVLATVQAVPGLVAKPFVCIAVPSAC